MEISRDAAKVGRCGLTHRWLIVLGLMLLQGACALWHLAGLKTIGHSDTAHYYAVARNIARGKANPDNVLWTYLGKPASVARPAGDYWGPGWPYALGFLMRFVGDSQMSALRICAFLSVFLPVVVFLLLERLECRRWVAVFGAVLICLQTRLFQTMVAPEVALSYELTTTAGFILFLGALKDRPTLLRLLPSAFVLTLPIWLRGEGFIPLLAATTGILAAPWPWRQRLRCVVRFAALAGICLIPYLLYNVHFFGRITPEPRSLTPLMTDIMQLYEFNSQPSLESYCKLGFRAIVGLRTEAAKAFAVDLWRSMPYLLLLAGTLGPLPRWIACRRAKMPGCDESEPVLPSHVPPAIDRRRAASGRPDGCRAAGIVALSSFVVLSAAVPLLVAPVVTNYQRFLPNVTPMLCVLAAWAIEPLLRYRWTVNLAILFVAAFLLSNVHWPFQVRKPWTTAWKWRLQTAPACMLPGNHPELNADDIVLCENPSQVSAQLDIGSIVAPMDDTVFEKSDGARKSRIRVISAETCRKVIQQYHPRFILAEDGSVLDQFVSRLKDLSLRVVRRGQDQDGRGYTWYAVAEGAR